MTVSDLYKWLTYASWIVTVFCSFYADDQTVVFLWGSASIVLACLSLMFKEQDY